MTRARLVGLAGIAGLAFMAIGGSALAQDPVSIGMPFAGYWNRYGFAPPATHPVYHSWTGAQWSTDLYAAPGTAVKFYVSSSATVKGKVKAVTAVPNCTWNGSAVDAGKYVAIDVMAGTKRLGSVVYVHLDAVGVTVGQEITSGTSVGSLKLWSQSTCYNVTGSSGVHTHFEAGSAITGQYSCWQNYAAGTSLAAGAVIGKVGTTGRTTKGACP